MDLNAMIRESFRELRASPENPNTDLSNPDRWLYEAFGAVPAGSGILVSEQSALRSMAVLACVRVLAETIASLPLHVYRKRSDGGKERADYHDAYPVLHDSFNPAMTSFVGRETLQGHVATRGNAYALIEKDAAGYTTALWPVPPDCIEPAVDHGALWYVITPTGTDVLGIAPGVYRPSDVLHVPGLGYDGLKGYSPIHLAREAVGLGIAAERFGAAFFGNGARPGGILTSEKMLTDAQATRISAEWKSVHEGVPNAHKVAVLSGNLKFQPLNVNPEDAQFLETRKFQVTEIARLFRIPPHMIGDLDRATFSNIEHQSLEFVIHTIRPWLVRWEQEFNRKMFTPRERNRYFVEFNVDGLLRGDIKSRYEAYQVAKSNGWLNADEIRALENMNPLPNGNGKPYYNPLNLGEVGLEPGPGAPDPSPPQEA